MAVAKMTTNNKKFYAVEVKTFQHKAKKLLKTIQLKINF